MYPTIISQHWFQWLLGAKQATNHNINQWCLRHWSICASLSLKELNKIRPTVHLQTHIHQGSLMYLKRNTLALKLLGIYAIEIRCVGITLVLYWHSNLLIWPSWIGSFFNRILYQCIYIWLVYVVYVPCQGNKYDECLTLVHSQNLGKSGT